MSTALTSRPANSGSVTISANGDTTILPDFTDEGGVLILQIVAAASWDGNITIKKKIQGSSAAAQATQYTKESDKTTAVLAISGVALNAQYSVDVAGCSAVLTMAGRTVGSVTVDYIVVRR